MLGPQEEWLTYDEASVVMRVDRSTIYRWWRAGLLREVRYTPSGRPLFLRRELEPRAAERLKRKGEIR